MELVKTTSLKFEVTETGHQIIQAEINGHRVNLILDTAAGASVLDRACIKKLGIKPKGSNLDFRHLILNSSNAQIKSIIFL